MRVLSFDTALNKTYIALNENGNIIEKMAIENSKDKYHSAFLIKEISNILKNNNLTMQNIDAVGIDVGPGSFTGIRACTTVGRVIAQQVEIPLVPVSSMEILAKINNGEKTLVTMDARKNSAFVAIYEKNTEILAPKIVKVEELTEMAKNTRIKIVCDQNMTAKLLENDVKYTNYEDTDYPLDEYLSELTYEKLMNAKGKNEFNWAKVKPLYIQPPSVFGNSFK